MMFAATVFLIMQAIHWYLRLGFEYDTRRKAILGMIPGWPILEIVVFVWSLPSDSEDDA